MYKKIIIVLSLLALVLIYFASIKSAMAYFTTYAEAEGSHPLVLQSQSEIIEKVEGWKKNIQIKNNYNTKIYVRVAVFSVQSLSISGEDWEEKKDDYWYYQKPLSPQDTTPVLEAKIAAPQDPPVQENFNVAVVYETIPVLYDKDGKPIEDWNQKVKRKELNHEE